ncbi:MAG: hypothetical protein NVSMB45_19130 [Ginsengibacter sp.]
MLIVAMVFISCNQQSQKTNSDLSVDTINSNANNNVPKQTLLVDIKSLLNKSPEQVTAILGKPFKIKKNETDCVDVYLKKCLSIEYRKGTVTVLYAMGQAYWFEFDKLSNYLVQGAPEIFGLANSSPTDGGPGYIWYKNYPGIKNLSVIPLASNPTYIDYVTVEVGNN